MDAGDTVARGRARIAQPAGNDQHLYLYTGQRVFEGLVPYVDAWDQKPPGIFFLYGALWQIWPRESLVAIADLGAAAITAWLLVTLGRRTGDVTAGRLAAVIYLAGSHPSLSRLSGVYVRGQTEVFIAMFVTAALVQCAAPLRTRARLIAAGACLGAAFVIKYNAAGMDGGCGAAGMAEGSSDGRHGRRTTIHADVEAAQVDRCRRCRDLPRGAGVAAAHGALGPETGDDRHSVRYCATLRRRAFGALECFVAMPTAGCGDPLW